MPSRIDDLLEHIAALERALESELNGSSPGAGTRNVSLLGRRSSGS